MKRAAGKVQCRILILIYIKEIKKTLLFFKAVSEVRSNVKQATLLWVFYHGERILMGSVNLGGVIDLKADCIKEAHFGKINLRKRFNFSYFTFLSRFWLNWVGLASVFTFECRRVEWGNNIIWNNLHMNWSSNYRTDLL